jgi:tRNA-(ms[2]io[6]A)-hydroxylase
MFCLTTATDDAWATLALADLPRLLADHAHCELKAASNAISLVPRLVDYPDVTRVLSELAREELTHYERVLELLQRRGLCLGAPAEDRYAVDLLKAVRALPKVDAIPAAVDRLVVAALIEARSCERFKLLIEALEASGADGEALALYKELFPSEARHYVTFVDLAVTCLGGDRSLVEARIAALAAHEGRIVASLATESERSVVHG